MFAPANAADAASRASGHEITPTGLTNFRQGMAAARFSLPNGLTILLVPDFSAPVFAYQSWVKVGSKHEAPNQTGMAHLFEHLMFKGTPTHPTGEFDRAMEQRGAQTNAATWVDWTYYTEALAARDDHFATVVAFEADRLANLIVDQATFASELEVVKNERRMSVDDAVAGFLGEQLYRLAFAQHPYRWPTIGSMAHLEAATVDDLRAFYQRYYAASNTVVVVAGAVEPDVALATIAQAYGPLPSLRIEQRARPVEPRQEEERFATFVQPVLAPQMAIGYHAPEQTHRDFPAAQILAEVLLSGDTGRLYQRLVTDEQMAVEVGGRVAPFAEPGLFDIWLHLQPGVKPQEALAVIDDEVTSLLAHGPEANELDKARHGLELEVWEEFRDVESFAETLGHYEAICGDFSQAFQATAAHANVTSNDVVRVGTEMLRASNRTTVVAQERA